jgi:hypothetical protein
MNPHYNITIIKKRSTRCEKKLMYILFLTCYFLLFCAQPIFAHDATGKRLFAYVGGAGEIVKINLDTFKIIKNKNSTDIGLVFGLQINPDGREIYVTGDIFSAPLIVIDTKTLKITRTLSSAGFEDAKVGVYYACRGKLSADGRRIAIDCKFGPTPFALIDTATLKTINRRREFCSNPLYEAIFSDDSKILYVLTRYQHTQKKTIFEKKIIIVNAETGEILKQIPLPELKTIKCNTNIATFTGERSNIYITCNCNFGYDGCARGLLKGDAVYPFIETSESKVIRLIEVKTGRIISDIPLPDGRGDLNQITLTPDGRRLLIGRGGYRHPGELTIVDMRSKRVIKRVMLEGGATSNVVFGYE